MLKKGVKTQLFQKSLKKRGKTRNCEQKTQKLYTKTIHKNDTITSKKGTFQGLFNLVKIRQKKLFEKKSQVNFGKKF